MYRVLIVDDEPEIRQGLRLKVNWDQLELQVAGEAANGIEALSMLEADDIDIVITDMNMPVMDGLSFLHSCREQYPALRLVVITGYEDFHYARAAVQNQARDYLLKPVTREELTMTLDKIRKELNNERASLLQEANMRWKLTQNYKEMKEHFLVRLVKGEQEYESLMHDRIKLFELSDWGDRAVRFVTAGLRERRAADPGSIRTPDQFRLPFELLCREHAESLPHSLLVFRDTNYPGLMHFILAEDGKAAESLIDGLRSGTSSHIGFEPTFGLSDQVVGFQLWKEGYLNSLLAWNLSESGVQEAAHPSAGEGPLLADDKVKVLQRLLTRGEIDKFQQAIEEELHNAYLLSRTHFVKIMFQLHLMLESAASALNIALETGDQLWVRPELATRLDTPQKVSPFLMRLANRIDRQQKHRSEEADRSLISAVVKFIDDNYMYDLNLTMIAERFHYHPSYFSELFKAKTGKSFIRHVTEVRMTQAIRLLEGTELSLWDIAELTGFSNASYFSSKFKRLYGVSPSQYRQKPPEKNDSQLPKK